MSFVYVTGCAGSGKSALAEELRRRGVEALDEDDPAVGSAHNTTTGQPVPVPVVERRNPQWFAEHQWRVFDDVVAKLRGTARNRLVVLCGSSFPPSAAIGLFDQIMYLDISEDTVRRRIERRVGNDYGKAPGELQRILDVRAMLREEWRRHDVRFVPAESPLMDVADAIVRAIAP